MTDIERVARAIEAAAVKHDMPGETRSLGYYASVGIDYFKHDHARYEELLQLAARAAIRALRIEDHSASCSTPQVDAGRIAIESWELTPGDFKRANCAVVDCWNAMIDQALEE